MRFWEATGEQSPAEAFIERIYSEYPVSPFNPRQRGIVSGEGMDQTIALFELEPSKSVRGAVELHWIQAYPQRQGVGTAAIRELQAKAREAGIKMSLYPKPNGSVSQASLKRLYKRLGFAPIHRGAATMVWDPAVSEHCSKRYSAYELALMEGGMTLEAEQLTELADKPYAFQIAQHGAEKSTFGFDTDSGSEYIVRIVPFVVGNAFQNNALDVSFALMQGGQSIDKVTGNAGTDALRIFGTVLEAVKQTLHKRTAQGLDIEYIQFKAVEKEPKRVELYQRFAKSIGRYVPGWKFWKSWTDDGISTSIVKRAGVTEDIDELEEDWRHVVTGLGAASMMAGGGSAAYDAYKAQQPSQPQAQVKQVQAPQAKIQAPQAKPQVPQISHPQAVSHAQDLLATKGAQILQKAAKAAGLKGSELAQFLAQCAHETANFTTLKELGDKNYFKKYDIKFNPAKAKELGNLRPGDGDLYKGRGFIQLTGRYNYKKAGEALGLPLERNPQLVERPDVAAKVALWFWKNRVQPNVDNFNNTSQATKPINPGLKGLSDRHNKYVGMKVATAKPQPKTVPAKVALAPAKPVKGKKV